MIEPDTWQAAGTPLLRDPRALVKRLHELHRPKPGAGIVAVLDADGRPIASASFETAAGEVDGWECRNTILTHLRMIVPDDLRRAAPVRTTVLLLCREGGRSWEPDDGRWMWGLRDACALHGLRCGATVVLGNDGWQVVGDRRSGRRPVPITGRAPAARRIPAPRPLPKTDVPPPVGLPTPALRADRPTAAAASADLSPPARSAMVRLLPDVASA